MSGQLITFMAHGDMPIIASTGINLKVDVIKYMQLRNSVILVGVGGDRVGLCQLMSLVHKRICAELVYSCRPAGNNTTAEQG